MKTLKEIQNKFIDGTYDEGEIAVLSLIKMAKHLSKNCSIFIAIIFTQL